MKSLIIHFNYKEKGYEAKIKGARGMGSKIIIEGIGECRRGETILYNNKMHHNCGAQGFNPYLGDKCRACNDSNEKSNLLSFLQETLWP